MIEIIPKIEFMISEAFKIDTKLFAIISDSASVYAGASELNDLTKLGEDDSEYAEQSKSNIVISDNWKIQLDDWEQILENKKATRIEKEEVEHENNDCNINSDLLSKYKHPVVDPKTK
ncbi:36787_t:CDS:2 [Racocetra persica]|uniref:36787_t:CDS:1 n=1 Tax=Racocetra persica TaxID=160502 RepID=A0ACA9KA49_9GLOM|nr:36787_t:CDS:2 [Racocetra persica]